MHNLSGFWDIPWASHSVYLCSPTGVLDHLSETKNERVYSVLIPAKYVYCMMTKLLMFQHSDYQTLIRLVDLDVQEDTLQLALERFFALTKMHEKLDAQKVVSLKYRRSILTLVS